LVDGLCNLGRVGIEVFIGYIIEEFQGFFGNGVVKFNGFDSEIFGLLNGILNLLWFHSHFGIVKHLILLVKRVFIP